jgi:hypothetical protein
LIDLTQHITLEWEQMFGKLITFFFSYFAVLAVIPLIVAIAVLIFKFDLRSFMDLHRLAMAIMMAGYAFFWVFAFFALQDYLLVWKPKPNIVPLGKQELVNKLERSFQRPFDGKVLFDVFRSDDDRVAITWSSSINVFQILSGGQKGKKRVMVLTLDENKHEAYLLMKEKDWAWSLSTKRFDFSMNFSSGIFAEISTDIAPSLTFDKDGGFSIDLKKLSYDYNELWLPIENTLLTGGWTIRSGMLPKLGYRLALALPFALLMFALFHFPDWKDPAPPSSLTGKESSQEAREVDRETYKKNEVEQSIVAGRLKSAKQLENSLDGLMKVPRTYFDDYKHVFVAQDKVYREKKDRSPEFVARLDAFVKEYGIDRKE